MATHAAQERKCHPNRRGTDRKWENAIHLCTAIAFVAVFAGIAHAEPGSRTAWPNLSTGPLEDNSFLIEEAYNQETGVIQHIFAARRDDRTGNWSNSFTEEWPVLDQRNQLSVTIPYSIAEHTDEGETGIEDVLLNYRYQALLIDETRFAVAPRLSVVLPTGNRHQGLGNGVVGLEGNLPVSRRLGDFFAVHGNLGGRVTPGAKSASDPVHTETLGTWFGGGSLIFEPWDGLNVLTEILYTRDAQVRDTSDSVEYRNDLILSPGFRVGFNGPFGVQYVAGAAVPIGLTPDTESDLGVFLYLSIEHGITQEAQADRNW